jgi:DNA repair protein RecN (Recombination protein N)
VADLEGGEHRIAALERASVGARAAYQAAADALSHARRDLAPEFARALVSLVVDLAMDGTRFEVRFGVLPESAWTARGTDSAEFYLSANPGESLRPLARIVSGGELSRVMLAIKTVTATSRFALSATAGRTPSASAPGLIFDEVDAGIGGRVADVVGRKLRALGSAFQVLCITHLPQIAAYADTHFEIEKRVEAGRTSTTVRRLGESGRVDELARMLGGEAITDGLRQSALEMLADRSKAKGEMTPKGESESPGAKRSARHTPAARRTPR